MGYIHANPQKYYLDRLARVMIYWYALRACNARAIVAVAYAKKAKIG